MTSKTTTSGHTLTISDDHRWLEIDGDVDTMDAIPDAEIDAFCGEHGVRCTYDPVDPTTYRLAAPSTGCECGTATGIPCQNPDATASILWMPESRRACHVASGGGRLTDRNGAVRLRVDPACAYDLLDESPDWVVLEGDVSEAQV